jgi:hypothetical protein
MKLLKHLKRPGIVGAFILALLLTNQGSIFRLGLTAGILPGVTTPSSLVITIDEADMEEAINASFRVTLFNTPASLDVVKNTGLSTNIFGSGTTYHSTYNGIRFILHGTGTYSGIDPCTGLDVTDAVVQLPDVANNQLVERLQVAHPVTGLQPGATGQIDAIHVGSDPVNLHLNFPASNSIGCVSDTPPSQVISGTDTAMASPFALFVDAVNNEIFVSNNDPKANRIVVFSRADDGDVSPQRWLQGPTTGINSPGGIFVDTVNNELDVANTGNDSISIYPRTWDPTITDVAPIRVISGAATGIRGPGGVYEYNDELYVTNGPDDSITVYDRNWNSAFPSPKRIIQGPTTGLDTPCGIYVDSNEIAVVNNGNNSITFYDQAADSTTGDVYPLRTIKGDKTAISNACGLYVDPPHNEVAVASAGHNSINFFSLSSGQQGGENVYPIRQIRGTNAELSQPVGVFLDAVKDEVAVANLGNNSITIHKRNDATPHLLYHPVFVNPQVQQQLLVSYVYSGQILRGTGQPMPPTDLSSGQPYTNDPLTNEPLNNTDPNTMARLPIPLPLGYAYVFKVYDPSMHFAGDVNSAYLIPPGDMQFHLADGSLASNLKIGCAVFTPFTIDELTTNCQSQALIISPLPPKPVTFHIAASVIGKVQNKLFVANIAELSKSELPLIVPRISLTAAGAILDINWTYANDSGQQLGLPPLVSNQSFQISYSKPYSEISACYQKRVKSTLAFSSGGMTSDVRSRTNIKDSGCDIFLKDVSNITFSTSDAYGNRYTYSWDVVD